MARKSSATSTEPNENETTNSQKKNNTLKIKPDDLKTFEPLTDNQKAFFDAYKRGDYFIALHGVAGTGKTFCNRYFTLQPTFCQAIFYHSVLNSINNSLSVFCNRFY